ncbi:transposase [Labilibaculum sp. K2S]|uniref:transposase n=1 Tax=Labilibaculum sp. K2S TaxID=3056386 RepID=UPI0025A3B433|nr:transposase [Labilibaculum sp. K2S]MDM8161164.1 transposase [Labilibaculum sp. K2S]
MIEIFSGSSNIIQTHYIGILNHFDNRSTNASAESFNAKIKAFRSSLRGGEIYLPVFGWLKYMPK